MSLARFFSKPRWLSKDAAIRRDSVASENAAELVAQLAQFAREDSDAGVRIAALKRLAEPGLAQALAQDDRDEGVRSVARNLFAELLAGTHPSSPPLSDRIRLLRAQDEVHLIEQIAVTAPEAELRLAALQRVERHALILERVTADADAAVRLAALERINDEAQLVRISERARKSDKAISRLATERVHALRIERGDSAAISTQATSLCEQLERLLREGGNPGQAETIANQWQAIAEKVPTQLATRYRNAHELFELSRDPDKIQRMRQRAIDRAKLESELLAIEQALLPASAHSAAELQERFNALAELHAEFADDSDEFAAMLSVRFARLGAQLATLKSAPAAEIHKPESSENAKPDAQDRGAEAERQARRDAARAERDNKQRTLISKLDEAIQEAARVIAQGKSAEAHLAHARIQSLRRELGAVPPALRDALADVESDYAKIQQWQRWGDGKRRQQLCEELEVLPETGLHPDAIATRVREIQIEWTSLDRLEARPARANDGIDRRFRALCHKAIEPTKPYFEKRDELRKQGTEETSQLIAEVRVTVAGEDPDWPELAGMRKRAVEGLRSLDRVDPRERKNLAAELKQVLGIIDERIAAHHAGIESTKAALISRAQALSEQTDTRSAITQARDLQKLWQATGNGKRSRDQAQWKIFRAAIDAVFGRADDERAQRSAQDRQAVEDATALCGELEAIAANTSEPDRAELHRIDSAWHAIGIRDAGLRQRFQNARDSLEKLKAERERNKRRAQFDVWLSHYEVLRKFEIGELDVEATRDARASLPVLAISADAFEARIREAGSGQTASPENSDLLRDQVLEAEQLAGIEPPEKDRQRRMDLQVDKLSARMRGVQAPAPAAALEQLLGTWIDLGSADSDLDTRFKRAVAAILDTLG
ncbi:MAG TPA: DUF349 domain-containing protein [Dokdonella sp.]|uniref:DUF349 domain-containing protein n=1 Tax=Dokdonella sp. TaxID=2291710 RepID=UPI002D80398E|nr:DUF349 domain-containing protein [Dokdonella sp.]HET9031956.1 DUF349 domain-containing protein [Dokdonella sp.]